MVDHNCEEIVGTSAHTRAIRQFAKRASQSTCPVMLLGEPGVGKELVARRIHAESSRSNHPFLVVDCSLYYERELKREFFGYHSEGPASKTRKGLLEFGKHGTCYLSRIEELSMGLQESLLDFLKTGKFCRLGDGRAISSDVHLIISSDKNLEGFVQGGLFNGELFGMLSELSMTIAPLRERAEDIEALALCLADAFRKETESNERSFSKECLEALKCFPWPRNYDELKRELTRVLESEAQPNASQKLISPKDLAFQISSYWLGQKGDPEIRKVIEELDGYIREFKVLSRLDAEFSDVLMDMNDWDFDSELEFKL